MLIIKQLQLSFLINGRKCIIKVLELILFRHAGTQDVLFAVFTRGFNWFFAAQCSIEKIIEKKVARIFFARTITRLVRNKTSCKASENRVRKLF